MLIEPQFGAGTRKGRKHKNSVDLRGHFPRPRGDDDHGYDKPTLFDKKKA